MQTCLELHALYACRHRGECCSAWQVPAEPHVIEFVKSRRSTFARDDIFLVDEGNRGQQRIVHTNGACVFRTGGGCEIHRERGEMALPVACRHFPRVILRDQRGTLTSLSHYCPTAAALLFEPDASLQVVAPGLALTVRAPIEGMDAREALPPLLHPRMLADVEGYDSWERSVIDTFAAVQDAGAALDAIELATEDVRQWTPARGPLAAAVRTAFAGPRRRMTRSRECAALDIVRGNYRGSLSLDLPRDDATAWEHVVPHHRADLRQPIANYLAARAFGNWIAYQGRGLRSIVAWLRGCHDVLRAIALNTHQGPGPLTPGALLKTIRLTDFVMLHSIDSHAFALAAIPLEHADAA